jgi:hypothetical protein
VDKILLEFMFMPSPLHLDVASMGSNKEVIPHVCDAIPSLDFDLQSSINQVQLGRQDEGIDERMRGTMYSPRLGQPQNVKLLHPPGKHSSDRLRVGTRVICPHWSFCTSFKKAPDSFNMLINSIDWIECRNCDVSDAKSNRYSMFSVGHSTDVIQFDVNMCSTIVTQSRRSGYLYSAQDGSR